MMSREREDLCMGMGYVASDSTKQLLRGFRRLQSAELPGLNLKVFVLVRGTSVCLILPFVFVPLDPFILIQDQNLMLVVKRRLRCPGFRRRRRKEGGC